MVEDEYADLVEDRRHACTSSRAAPSRGGNVKTVGVLEKKAKTTYICGEAVIGKGHKGMRIFAPCASIADRDVL